MVTRIEVAPRTELTDARGDGVHDAIRTFLGMSVDSVATRTIYKIDAELDEAAAERIRTEFTDPVTQRSSLARLPAADSHWVLTVGFRPGVTDNLGRSARIAIEDLLGAPLVAGGAVYTETEYHLAAPRLGRADVARIGHELLANLLIETLVVQSHQEWASAELDLAIPVIRADSGGTVRTIDLSGSDDELLRISREGTLSLSLVEMQTIRDHYTDPATATLRAELGLAAAPTDVELECLAQTWSEHCKHKIFNATIDYREGARREIIKSIFARYIRGTTEKVGERIDWLVSVFTDNAGVIRLDEQRNLVYKVETHNSPSALDPYGGAMTGIVGVNRDPFGTGIGAELFANVWGYCLASPFYSGALPQGLLHPRRIRDGVHKGVIDGGNQSGLPYGRGWEIFDERYLGKPLVYCGTVGIMPREVVGKPSHEKHVEPGDMIAMVGGRIGKDGIHGATFSSEELHADSPVQAVQIGDPITQKKMTDFLLEARDLGLYTSITDNGAGGLASSIGEMATLCGGARIDLARAPVKYAGLEPWEILESEAQERMTVGVPPAQVDAFLDLAARREVEATILGEFTSEPIFHVLYGDRTAGYIDMAFLHDGCPTMELEAVWNEPAGEAPPTAEPPDGHTNALRAMVAHLNLCSGEDKARQYDHEVKGLSVIKPFIGVSSDVPSDGAVFLAGHDDSTTGIVLSEGIRPRYSDLDTYHMAIAAVDLAVRRAVAVGGEVGKLAALDNFCWPDPVQSERTPDGHYKLAQLVRACRGLSDACLAFDLPLISGKDSMKNDSTRGGVKISIPPTLLVSVIGVIDDIRRCITLDAKRAGDLVYIIGKTRAELGASEYLDWLGDEQRGQGWLGTRVPTVDPEISRRACAAISAATRAGILHSAHAIGPGGLALALARTAMAGELGIDVALDNAPISGSLSPAEILYSESGGRFLVTIASQDRDAFAELTGGLAVGELGSVSSSGRLEVGFFDRVRIDEDVLALKKSWKETLRGI